MRIIASVAVLLVISAGMVAPAVGETATIAEPMEVLGSLTRAFNAHDPDGLVEVVADSVRWYSIHGGNVSIEAGDKRALRDGLRQYFDNIPSARSVIEDSMVSGRYVVVRERSYWMQGDDQRSQSALAVYEIEDAKVLNVWYFPPED